MRRNVAYNAAAIYKYTYKIANHSCHVEFTHREIKIHIHGEIHLVGAHGLLFRADDDRHK